MMSSDECIFCQIAHKESPASIVYEDEIAIAFLDILPINPGHILIIPRKHAAYLADLDEQTGMNLFKIGQRMAALLRITPEIKCEGVNFFLADGEAAAQEIFHVHLHVFPRFAGDHFTLSADWNVHPSREELDSIAGILRNSLSEK